jgi:hypothetical protein
MGNGGTKNQRGDRKAILKGTSRSPLPSSSGGENGKQRYQGSMKVRT